MVKQEIIFSLFISFYFIHISYKKKKNKKISYENLILYENIYNLRFE